MNNQIFKILFWGVIILLSNNLLTDIDGQTNTPPSPPYNSSSSSIEEPPPPNPPSFLNIQITRCGPTAAAGVSLYDSKQIAALSENLSDLLIPSELPPEQAEQLSIKLLDSSDGGEQVYTGALQGGRIWLEQDGSWMLAGTELTELLLPLLPDLPAPPENFSPDILENQPYAVLRIADLWGWQERTVWQEEEVARITAFTQSLAPLETSAHPDTGGNLIMVTLWQQGEEKEYSFGSLTVNGRGLAKDHQSPDRWKWYAVDPAAYPYLTAWFE